MEEIRKLADIQRQAWGLEDLEIVPTFEMKAISDVGILLAAFDQENEPIGFIYGFHQFPDIHYSHMMAVVPSMQGTGVGYEMKKTHRTMALGSPHRVNYIKWTVDPLLPNNAYLNFAKLGSYCDKYYIDYYGDASGFELYKGLATDRFLVTWPIRSQRVEERMKNYKAHRISKEELLEQSPPVNAVKENKWMGTQDFTRHESFSVQVPSDFHSIRKTNLEIAIHWRTQFRNLCVQAFASGWKVIDYHSFGESSSRENYYEFSKHLPL